MSRLINHVRVMRGTERLSAMCIDWHVRSTFARDKTRVMRSPDS
jgi:hypothetical protein